MARGWKLAVSLSAMMCIAEATTVTTTVAPTTVTTTVAPTTVTTTVAPTNAAPTPSCKPKTGAEVVASYRAEKGCPNANPTGCVCVPNGQPQYACPVAAETLWDSDGKMCIRAMADKDSTWAKHNWSYPADHFSTCEIPSGAGQPTNPRGDKRWIEPGSYDCTKVAGKTHKWKNPDAGYNSFYNSSTWCSGIGCYVDPCTCDKADIGISSWYRRNDSGPVYYSYAQCGASNVFAPALCSGRTTQATCEQDIKCKWEVASATTGSTQTSSDAQGFDSRMVGVSATLWLLHLLA